MVSCSHGISLLAFNSVSHLFAILTGEILSRTMEEKFHVPMYYSLFISFVINYYLCS